MSQVAAVSKTRTVLVFIFTILLGFMLFVVPNVFFGVFKFNGGLKGINLLFVGLFQFVSVCALLYLSLKLLKKDFSYIRLSFEHWKRDVFLGLLFGLGWTILQFAWIIPATGGAGREDVADMVARMDGNLLGMLSFIGLGVIGGGITEEIYNRGYFISVLKDTFKNPRIGLWFSVLLSILFFAAGHLPSDALGWFDILVPTLLYTLLFLYTKRLTAPIVAHGIYNMLAVILTYYMYGA